MASAAPPLRHLSAAAAAPPRRQTITCVKQLAESSNLTSIPPNYAYYTNSAETKAADPGDSIPIVDLSLLTSDNPDQRSKAIQDLDKACRDWGFFMVVNHGVAEELMNGILDGMRDFFNLPEEEKPEFQPKDVVTPIRYGTSFNTEKEQILCWRDFLKVYVHPDFSFPERPDYLRNRVVEYSERCRGVVSKLMKALSESLGMDGDETTAALGMASTLQILVANLYPRCPNPEAAMGMPPHSDHSLFTLVIENGVGGLQLQRDGRWINVNALPNSILVNTGDQLEIFSNGKYKSVLHRVVVNDKKTRITVAMANGPSSDTVVRPAPQLVRAEGCVPAFVPIKYGDYILTQQSNQLDGKSSLKRVKIIDH